MKRILLLILLPIIANCQINLFEDLSSARISSTKLLSDSIKTYKILKVKDKEYSDLLQSTSNQQIFVPIIESGKEKILKIEISPVNILADNFKLKTPNGEFAFKKPKFYRGKINGVKDSFVALTMFEGQIEGLIQSEDFNFTIGKIKDNSNNHIIYKTSEAPGTKNLSIKDEVIEQKINSQVKHQDFKNARVAKTGSIIGTVNIYLEAEHQLFNDWGGDVNAVSNQIISIFNNVALIFANEDVEVLLSELFIWTTSDPYTVGLDDLEKLFLFKQRNRNFNGDVAQLLGSNNYNSIVQGWAYMGSGTPVYGSMTSRATFSDCTKDGAFSISRGITNSSTPYPVFSSNVYVIAHELGHNFGLNHTHNCDWPGGPIDNCAIIEGNCNYSGPNTTSGTIMSYCGTIDFTQGFGQLPGDKLRAEVLAATCLTSSCSVADFRALKEFYNSLGGDNWTNRSGWDYIKNNNEPGLTCNLNMLYGVTTQIIGNKMSIVGISLPNNNLVGSLPDRLFDLHNLKNLNIPNNLITGNIPSNISFLRKLEKLNLAHNSFSGSIPNELGNMATLDTLLLNNNQLSGCFHPNLLSLCSNLNQVDVNTGNSSLLASWSNFCATQAGMCNIAASLADFQALKNLYTNTNGDNWTNKGNWNIIRDNNTPPIGFNFNVLSGVESEEINGQIRVTKLTLFNNNLVGTLDSTIGNLTEIKQLSIGRNNLSGNIPKQIGNLTKAWSIYLAINQLSGNLPKEMGNLNQLEYLYLSSNNLTGSIPPEWGGMSSLKDLVLSANQLSGTLPVEIGNLSNLNDLLIQSNQFSGNLPVTIGNLVNLTDLVIYGNQFSGTVPNTIGNCSNLRDINAFDNQLSGSLPVEICNLTNLKNLSLQNNQLSGTLPANIGNLANLTTIDISNNFFSGSLPGSLGDLNLLTILYIQNNAFSGCFHPNLKKLCSHVTSFQINQGNQGFIGYWDQFCDTGAAMCSRCNLNDYNALRDLYQSTLGDYWTNNSGWNYIKSNVTPDTSCTFSGVYGVKYITENNTQYITSLNLGNNNLIGSLQWTIGDLPKLSKLNLANNQLSGTIPADIGSLEVLDTLLLNNNELVGDIPGTIGNIQTLKNLNLSNNQLTGCYSSKLKPLCNSLLAVSIEQGNAGLGNWLSFCGQNVGVCLNNLNCSNDDFQTLKSLYNSTDGDNWVRKTGWLYVKNNPSPPPGCELNDLYGVTIWPDGRVKSIEFFRNNLTGPIPSNIGNLSQLEYLSLGWNNLSGTIPASLYSLDSLKFLSLGQGRFTGIIPKEIENLKQLKVLDLQANRLTSKIPNSINKLTKLTHLYLGQNKFTAFPDSMNNLTELKELHAILNEISSDLPFGLSSLTKLEKLMLAYNQITGDLPSEFGNLTALKEINLFVNKLTGPLPVSVGNLTNLTSLILGGNKFSGSLPPTLGNLSNLEQLWISESDITGPIPTQIGNLQNLNYLNLSLNKLTGKLPKELGQIPTLRSLYLDNNLFEGCYDSTLHNLCTQLTGYSIDLSNPGLPLWSSFCSNYTGACVTCLPELSHASTLNDFSSGTHSFKTNAMLGTINLSNKINGNARIDYHAGKYILLEPGFKAEKGTVFLAKNGGCEN